MSHKFRMEIMFGKLCHNFRSMDLKPYRAGLIDKINQSLMNEVYLNELIFDSMTLHEQNIMLLSIFNRIYYYPNIYEGLCQYLNMMMKYEINQKKNQLPERLINISDDISEDIISGTSNDSSKNEIVVIYKELNFSRKVYSIDNRYKEIIVKGIFTGYYKKDDGTVIGVYNIQSNIIDKVIFQQIYMNLLNLEIMDKCTKIIFIPPDTPLLLIKL